MSPAGIEDRHASVLLWLIIDIKGKPQALRISRSAGKDFDNSALAAVRAWRFKPATCNGEPMPFALSVEVKFSNNRWPLSQQLAQFTRLFDQHIRRHTFQCMRCEAVSDAAGPEACVASGQNVD